MGEVDINKYESYNNPIGFGKITPLSLAVWYNSISIAEYLLSHGASVNDAFTPLTNAVITNNMPMTKLLAANGANIHLRSLYGTTPYDVMCKVGSIECLELFIKNREDIQRALFKATENGHVAAVNWLIQAGADVNAYKTTTGYTPIHFTIRGMKQKRHLKSLEHVTLDHCGCLISLIKAGADVNKLREGKYSPLYCSAIDGNEAAVNVLLSTGEAKVNQAEEWSSPLHGAVLSGRISCVRLLIEAGADLNNYNKECDSPLNVACKGGILACVRELINAGADINGSPSSITSIHQPGVGQKKLYVTPLYSATDHSEYHLSCLELLLKAGADVNHGEYLPLVKAAFQGNLSSLELLIAAGADINLCDIKGRTALGEAIAQRKLDCMERLIQAGAQLNSLHLIAAIKSGQIKSVELLLSHLRPDDCNNCANNVTPLIVAIRCKNKAIVKLLLTHGAQGNLPNQNPLLTAIGTNNISIVQLLIAHGVQVNRTVNYETPLMRAIRLRNVDMARLLLEHDGSVVTNKEISLYRLSQLVDCEEITLLLNTL